MKQAVLHEHKYKNLIQTHIKCLTSQREKGNTGDIG